MCWRRMADAVQAFGCYEPWDIGLEAECIDRQHLDEKLTCLGHLRMTVLIGNRTRQPQIAIATGRDGEGERLCAFGH